MVVIGVMSDYGGLLEVSEDHISEHEGNDWTANDENELGGNSLGSFGSDSLPTYRTATPVFYSAAEAVPHSRRILTA